VKASSTVAISFVPLGIAGYAQMARADTADANCEVRKDGEKMKDKSGPCTFGQRPGYIDIALKNGDTSSLKPTGSANHYKGQKGIKAVRTSAGGNTQDFKWEGGRKLIVTFNSSSYFNNGYSGNLYGAAGYGAANGSAEYQRSVNDAIKGRQYDRDRHRQDYKDGFRAGEVARAGHNNSGHANGNSGNGNCSINRMSNDGFEVLWTKHGCIVTFNARGEAMHYSHGCNGNQISRSQDIARQQR